MVVTCSTIDYVGFDHAAASDERNQAVARLRSRWKLEDFDTNTLPPDIETVSDLASYAYRVWKFDTESTDLTDIRLVLTPTKTGYPGWEVAAAANVEDLNKTLSLIAESRALDDYSMADFAYSTYVRSPRKSDISW